MRSGGGRVHPRVLIEGFNEAVGKRQLMDLGYSGSKFTWERSRGSVRWIQERLDRGLVTQQWKDMFPLAKVNVLEISTSDHLPLHLQLNRQMYVPKGYRFRFENIWLREKDCFNIIQQCWCEHAGIYIIEKLQMCCFKLEQWGGGMMKETNKKLNECRQKLRGLRSWRDAYGVKKYNETRWEFLNLLKRKEAYWQQRAK